MREITPLEAGQVSEAVYLMQDSPDIGAAFVDTTLAEHFDFGSKPGELRGTAERFTARSGVFQFKSRTGFAVMAKGRSGKDFPDQALLVCRGTDSAYDWLTDANYAVVLGPSGSPVHAGFNRVFQDLKPGFSQFMATHAPRHVHCVGHSLGGAIATLAAAWLSSLGVNVTLYTFGSPRVGTENFAQHVTSRIGTQKIFRVCHSSDPVTMVPVWPYIHAPRPDGECWFNRSLGLDVTSHFMQRYSDSVGSGTWAELRFPTPTMALEYGVRMMTMDSMMELLRTAPLLAFSAAVRLICKPVAITLLPGMSILDQLSIWVEKAATISVESDHLARTLLNAVVKLLGLALTIPQNITHAIVRTLFKAFLDGYHSQALRASAMAMSRVM